MDIGYILIITLTGMLVVFLALILLVFCMWALGQTAGRVHKKPKAVTVSEAPSTPIVPVASPSVQTGISEQTIAAISAAVSCAMEGDQPFAIQSITRVPVANKDGRLAWRLAGITDNTQPF